MSSLIPQWCMEDVFSLMLPVRAFLGHWEFRYPCTAEYYLNVQKAHLLYSLARER